MSLVLICSLCNTVLELPFNNNLKIGINSGKLYFFFFYLSSSFIVETSWHLQEHISCGFIKLRSHSGEF